MTDRFRVVPAAYVVFRRDRDGHSEVLLQLRRGTGYMDGFWATAAAGHVEADESVRRGRVPREPSRSSASRVEPADLTPLCRHAPHRPAPTSRSTNASTSSSSAAAGTASRGCSRRRRRPISGGSHSTPFPAPVVPHELVVLERLRDGTPATRSSRSASEPRRTIPGVRDPQPRSPS